ncbi:MAG TPA: hypothetical protein VKU60_19335 [Chloroflexota bacterium]|nr:hypothetical protein [Chloroflexota bacterium]
MPDVAEGDGYSLSGGPFCHAGRTRQFPRLLAVQSLSRGQMEVIVLALGQEHGGGRRFQKLNRGANDLVEHLGRGQAAGEMCGQLLKASNTANGTLGHPPGTALTSCFSGQPGRFGQRAALQTGRNRLTEISDVARFQEVTERTAFQRLNGRLERGVPGDDNAYQVGIPVSCSLEQLQAASMAKPKVHDQ